MQRVHAKNCLQIRDDLADQITITNSVGILDELDDE